jgi:hypothetical protein
MLDKSPFIKGEKNREIPPLYQEGVRGRFAYKTFYSLIK